MLRRWPPSAAKAVGRCSFVGVAHHVVGGDESLASCSMRSSPLEKPVHSSPCRVCPLAVHIADGSQPRRSVAAAAHCPSFGAPTGDQTEDFDTLARIAHGHVAEKPQVTGTQIRQLQRLPTFGGVRCTPPLTCAPSETGRLSPRRAVCPRDL